MEEQILNAAIEKCLTEEASFLEILESLFIAQLVIAYSFEADISGSGKIKAFNLQVKELYAEISGSGDAGF